MQECSITAEDLACRRGERVLFSGLGLKLAPGQALHVAGANGIGKSSLLRILAGLLRPFAGRVERTGTIGLLDERPALDPEKPLGRALTFWQRLDGPADNELARLGLSGLADVPVRYLSTGQKKRAAFARLIGQGAPVWLLDEPFNGLDGDGARLAEALAEEHCRAGGICVIASHQPFTLAGMRTLDLADYAPPLAGGEGIEGWGFDADGQRKPIPSNTPTQPPPQRGGAPCHVPVSHSEQSTQPPPQRGGAP